MMMCEWAARSMRGSMNSRMESTFFTTYVNKYVWNIIEKKKKKNWCVLCAVSIEFIDFIDPNVQAAYVLLDIFEKWVRENYTYMRMCLQINVHMKGFTMLNGQGRFFLSVMFINMTFNNCIYFFYKVFIRIRILIKFKLIIKKLWL